MLTTDSPTYFGEHTSVYYENTRMHVSKEGLYDLVINSTVGIYAKVYKNYFYSMSPATNLLLQSYGDCIFDQIKFTINLWPDRIYYLIVATTSLNATSSFSIVSTGPSDITFNKTSEYYYLSL
jgi:hypothetical protein